MTCSPRTPAPTRKHRRPYQALQERLARCEELLKQFAGSSGPAQQQDQSHATPVTSGTKPEQMDSKLMSVGFPESWKPACKMINEDGGVRFLDSYIWATISEEVRFSAILRSVFGRHWQLVHVPRGPCPYSLTPSSATRYARYC